MSDRYEPNQWYPTPELRFVERIDTKEGKWVNVLQQRWICNSHNQETEWRDVPLVEEEE